MKGLYCKSAVSDAEPKFVIQETTLPDALINHQVRVQVKACGLSPLDLKLLSDVGDQRDLIPVGREVAGVILQVGPKVTSFHPEDEVVGILPLDAPCSGLCDIIDIDEHYLVQKPEKLSSVCVAAALRDGLCAYTALHTHARMAAGQTVLVMDGASPFGLMCVQLAGYHGAKVLTTSHSPDTHAFLEQLRPSVGVQEPLVARVIPVYTGSDMLPLVLEETGGLGVDIVVDSGVRLQEENDRETDEDKLLPHKHDIISALGVGGHWVTSHQDLQLDPPDCRLLHLKSASISFLNPEVWTASSAQQGRYLHILKDIVEKMSAGVLRPQPQEALPLYEATVAMETVQRRMKQKAVIQL
ncbi:quinone oxidoreductase-like protein 1 isoform X1 [Gouania willdenowi]|uniref:Enoyl reductase (ER) domain-containing protein n=1 Tax=Gouania willdenowi TaxID=441366 RepID=A0A8C5G656_GOUWI|nr:quinone oxidoreductase-like protein 1 isoform X1 [Gouania willdenowi]XP_028325382.1 quinone oxidoreductase-like protein 1 isoform X1 [Gouania willdenowi]